MVPATPARPQSTAISSGSSVWNTSVATMPHSKPNASTRLLPRVSVSSPPSSAATMPAAWPIAMTAPMTMGA